ncbi:hypothetical protein D6C90_05102 [Aureobasidium pullulans]|uniref:Uncharacterized protein n=1 Tax=Aureobasidium pullulans TaxID=5580 RepID=A0A4S8X8E9_AURPU|nr:hypothetical protein D6D21_09403 [Aureobasidium pullulans]THY43285.1 hypothetical protein D6C97_09296 [Aureobasidium pullulans]THZ43191.1 hypothetical protein D6C90_05102 [Aureobasidium pullulans]
MSSAEIDRMVLAHWATQARKFNMILSQGICKVLAISCQLTDVLNRAYGQRTVDMSKETRSVALYQHIIFLAKEGLAHTEIYILPFCGRDAHAELQIMAVKMQATFHYIFCMYHNTPTVRQLQARQRSVGDPNSLGAKYMAAREDWVGLSGSPAPSLQSYITNPYAAEVKAAPVKLKAHAVQSPVSTAVPPTLALLPRTTPARPPGLGMDRIIDYDPPVCASAFLMPIMDYTPNTKLYFESASRRAKRLMPPSHVISLSVAHAHSEFLYECLGDYYGAMDVIKDAIRAAIEDDPGVYRRVGVVDGEVVYDSSDQYTLIREMSTLAQEIEKVSDIEPVQSRHQQVISPPLHPPPDRELPSPPGQDKGSAVAKASHQRNESDNINLSPAGGVSLGSPYRKVQGLDPCLEAAAMNSPTAHKGHNGTTSRNDTLVGSPPPVMDLDTQIQLINKQIQKDADDDLEAFNAMKAAETRKRDESDDNAMKVAETRKRDESDDTRGDSSKGNGGRMEGAGTEKQRKRRVLERAEDRLERQRKAAITKAALDEPYSFV